MQLHHNLGKKTHLNSPTLFNILWHNDNSIGCCLCFSKDGFNFIWAIIVSMTLWVKKRITLLLSIWLPILTLWTILAICSTLRLVARKKVIAGKERVEDGIVLLVFVYVVAQSMVVVEMLWCCVGWVGANFFNDFFQNYLCWFYFFNIVLVENLAL